MFWKKKDPHQKARKQAERKMGALLEVQPERLPSSIEKSNGDWLTFRPDTNVALKIWLPERLDDRLRQIADHEITNRSSLIRDTLFIYVYGNYSFLQMQEECDGFFYTPPALKDIMYSRTCNRTPQLGKNSISYKVWLPEALKNDLQALADRANLKLSHFVREILISYFMGHLELPVRQELIHQASTTPEDWPSEDTEQE